MILVAFCFSWAIYAFTFFQDFCMHYKDGSYFTEIYRVVNPLQKGTKIGVKQVLNWSTAPLGWGWVRGKSRFQHNFNLHSCTHMLKGAKIGVQQSLN